MLRSLRLLAFASATALSFAASAQTQTLTFTNSTPPVQVTLEANSQVQIGTTGNVTARCQLSGNNCVGITASNGNAPTVQISSSTNATTTGSNITITATVSGAQACERTTGSGSTGSVSGWSGFTAGTNAAAGGAFTAGSAGTFQFQLKCWNDAGSASSAAVPVTITASSGGGGSEPPAFCAGISAPAGFNRDNSKSVWTDLFPLATGTNVDNTPPKFGTSTRVPIFLSQGTYVSARFTTGSEIPSTINIKWTDLQGQQSADVFGGGTFINISACPGDFGLRTTQTPGDPNSYPTCRNHRPASQTSGPLVNSIEPENASQANLTTDCPLQPNTTYYLNYIWANPTNGISPGENSCAPEAGGTCGVQIFQ